jgi:hypothetical protein
MSPAPRTGEGGEAGTIVIDEATLAKIDAVLHDWNEPESEGRKLYEGSRAKWEKTLEPAVEAIKASERLTEEDFAIRINTRD